MRKMVIGPVDIKTTKKLEANKQRKAKTEDRLNAYKYEMSFQGKAVDLPASTDENFSDNSDSDEGVEYEPPVNLSLELAGPSSSRAEKVEDGPSSSSASIVNQVLTTPQMRTKLPATALACDRTGVSDRSAAIIANAVLEDMGLLEKSNPSMTIDRMKIRRERASHRLSLKEDTTKTMVQGIFFDGRKDKTLYCEKEGDTTYRRTISEEHITILQEPGSKYLGHVTPKSSKAVDIKTSIMDFVSQNFDRKELIAIGCDGTITNTGHDNGVIRLIEESIGRPLQWLVCLFHLNELPLRHLLKFLDGETAGPFRFKGIIGQQLENCENQPIAKFKSISNKLPIMDCSNYDLSTDQKYLLEMVKAIELGYISASLAKRNPGKLSHARWLTTANRILRLYVATEKPTEGLCILTEYITKVYAPVWFNIKLKPSCAHGARHLFSLVQLSRFLPDSILEIIDPVIQRNAYFSHPENILLALLVDEDLVYKELGIRRIIKARNEKPHSEIRVFTVPTINFKADHYSELIEWKKLKITESPITKHKGIDLLRGMECDFTDILKFPCHTQAVERCVRLVTEASLAVATPENREGFIKARIKSRNILPSFEKKADYFVKK